MTARQARRWKDRRAVGRINNTLRAGIVSAATTALVFVLGNDAVPSTFIGAASLAVGLVGALLAYFHWSCAELRYSLFLKEQACSESVSRA